MAKPVLFATGLGASTERCENLRVLFDAYLGRKKLISLHSPEANYEVLSGDYDLMVTDVFPVISPGKTIMVWHGIQGGKFIGLTEDHTYYRKEYADLIDCIIAAGCGAVDMWHISTNVPKSRIAVLGMPRTDRYIGKKKGDGHTILAKKKRSYLYVPTFRNVWETDMPSIDWKWIDSQLTDDELLCVKAHPYGGGLGINHYKHIFEANCMDPSANYLYDCDVVITDYSSIIFDGYLLNKPSVLFEKNKGYCFTRGMYMDYPTEYGSRYATTEEELLQLIRTADGLTETEIRCRDNVAGACDGHSCEWICKLIDRMNGGNENG